MWTGLTLIQLDPRRPAAYTESIALTTTPSWPAARASCETRSAASGSLVTSPGMRCAGAILPSSSRRTRSGSSMRSRPSTWSTSKNQGCSTVSRATSAPNRDIVSWNGRGVSFSSRASVSPSRMTAVTGMAFTTSTTSGSRCVMSARLRVKMRTSSPLRCTWMRAPSSLNSTDASPVDSDRLGRRRGRRGEHRRHGATDDESDGVELFCGAGEGQQRRLTEIAREHRCATDGVRPGDRRHVRWHRAARPRALRCAVRRGSRD